MREVLDYIGHPYLDQFEEAVSAILKTLEKYDYSDRAIYIAQECLLLELVELESAAREFKELIGKLRGEASTLAVEAKDESGEISESVKMQTKELYQQADDYEIDREVLQFGRWLFRYVGDALAWHAYGHNRRIIRALASKEPVPAIADLDQVEAVRSTMRQIRLLGPEWLPVLHDITNCLRTADLSIFLNRKLARIVELKFREGQDKPTAFDESSSPVDDRAARQVGRIRRVLRFMETLELGDLNPELAGGKALDSSARERHNFESISSIIEGARESDFAFDSPETGLMYVAWNLDTISAEDALRAAADAHPDVFESTITFRSISGRYDQLPEALPITAMALPAEDIIDILFGRIGVVTVVNFQLLEQYCEERGVPLKILAKNQDGYSIEVQVGEHRGQVMDGLWNRLLLEALSIESFSGLIQTIISHYESPGQEDSA